jgi:hypothetical protein
MTTWDNSDFDREASSIARAFWEGYGNNGAPLSEIATKVARDNSLNPEQIRRLCRTANTRAFEQKHAALKGSSDRTPSFDLADPESVIGQLYQDVKTAHEKRAFAEYPDLRDEYAPEPDPAWAAQEKVASLNAEIGAYLSPQRSPFAELRRLEKAAEDLRIERATHNMAWEDYLGELSKLASYQAWDHAEFEKNVVALYGGDALPELNALRSFKKMAAVGEGARESAITEKLAGLQRAWIGAETPASRLVKRAMETRAEFFNVVQKQKLVDAKIAELRKVVRRGK